MAHDLTDGPGQAGRLPFSRPFAQAGFSRDEAEEWRRAGWGDPTEAAQWHDLARWCSPRQLRSLALEGFVPADIECVARLFPSFTAAWTRALADAVTAAEDTEIDLRDRVRRNLHRDRRGPLRLLASGRPRP